MLELLCIVIYFGILFKLFGIGLVFLYNTLLFYTYIADAMRYLIGQQRAAGILSSSPDQAEFRQSG